jgi:acyl carrier protein
MQEETQHVRTDAGYLKLLNLDESSREQWGRWFIEHAAKDASGLAGLDGVWTFLVEQHPQLAELSVPWTLIDNVNLRQNTFLKLLNHKKSFLLTKQGARFDRFEHDLFKVAAAPKMQEAQAQAAVSEGHDTVLELIVTLVSSQLNMEAARVDVNQHLMLFGLDSVGAVSIATELEQTLNVKVSPRLLYEHETIKDLAITIAKLDTPLD